MGKNRVKKLSILLILALCFISTTCFASTKNLENKKIKHPKVAFISSYAYDWESIPKQLSGYKKVINGYATTEYFFMNTKKISYKNACKNTYNSIMSDIKHNGKYDIVLAGDDSALSFVLEYRNNLFKDTPVIYEGINSVSLAKKASSDPLITGIVEQFPIKETLQCATKLYPNAKNIVAISDSTPSGIGSTKQYYQCKKYFSNIKFKDISTSNLTQTRLAKKIQKYDENTIVLFLLMSEDKNSTKYSVLESSEFLFKNVNVPIFKADELGIGNGLLGGCVISYNDMGSKAGDMVLSIINGTPVSSIPQTTIKSRYVFDKNIIDKFNIEKSELPKNSVLKNNPPSFFTSHKSVLIPTFLIILILTVLLISTFWFKYKDKKRFNEIREKDLMLNQVIENLAGGTALYKIGDKIETLYSSEGIPKLSGRTMEEYNKWIEGDLFKNTVFKHDLNRVETEVTTAIKQNKPIDITYRLNHKNGSIVWIQLSAMKIREEDGDNIYYAVFTKLPEETELYRHIADDSLTGIYVSEKDTYELLYVNETIKSFVGTSKPYKGEKCYKYLMGRDKPCDFCKVDKLSKDNYIIRDIYLENRNMYFEMRGKLVEWNNKLAHIEYAANITDREKDQKESEKKYKEQMAWVEKMSKDYLANYKINLSKNTFSLGYGTNKITPAKRAASNSLDDFFAAIASCIPYKQDKTNFLKTFNRDNLIKCFKENKTTVSCEYRAIYDGENINWNRGSIFLTKNPFTNEIEGFAYAIDIKEEKVFKLLSDKAREQEYESLICIDAKTNSYMTYLNADTPQYHDKYNESMFDFIDKYYALDDLEEFKNKVCLKTIINELEKNDNYVVLSKMKFEDSIYYRKSIYTYIDKDSKLICLLRSDITNLHMEQEEQKEKLKNALQIAQNANKAKSEFLSRMSHDMRTPMNVIIGMANLAKDEISNYKLMSEYLNNISSAGDFLLELINDCLDLEKISNGKMELHPSVYTYAEFEKAIKSMILPLCKEKDITFITDEDYKDIPVHVDKIRFEQIFFNLLSNAVKFTPQGGTIEFKHIKASLKDDVLSCDYIVKDSGIGISEEFMTRLFEPFTQESNVVSPTYTGTGLGLVIVKNIVQLMKGTIEVKSEKGRGSEFIIHLDLPIAKEELTSLNEITPKGKNKLLDKHILIAEDHPINSEIIKKLLEKKGVIYTYAEDGKIATEIFENSKLNYFDAILMDIRMPNMNGLEASKYIRSLNRADAKTVPIIAMTANAFDKDKQDTLNAGMNFHLSKPIKPDVLYKVLEEYIK